MSTIDALAKQFGYTKTEKLEEQDMSEPVEIERGHLQALIIKSISSIDTMQSSITAFDSGDKARSFSFLGAEIDNTVKMLYRLAEEDEQIRDIIEEAESLAHDEMDEQIEKRMPSDETYIQ